MAQIADVLAHVERVEYLKELARLIAQRIGDDVDLQDALSNPDFVDSLIADLVDALEGRNVITGAASNASKFAATVGLSELSEEDRRTLITETVSQVTAEGSSIISAEVDRLTARVASMTAAGVGDEVVAAAIGASDLGSSLSSALVSVAGSIVTQLERDTLDQARADFAPETATADEPPPDWRWVTMEDDRVCDGVLENSCAPRHGQELSEDEWSFMGQPGGFNLICSYYAKGPSSNCRCFLEPADGAATSPSPVNISSAIESGKSRAEQDWEEAA